MADNGFRAVAHDRRGGGRSGQPWDGNDLDTYADDQIVPIVAAGDKSSKLVKGAVYKVYPGAPHGLAMVPKYAEVFNADLLEFARG